MSAYAYINGEISCDEYLDSDIEGLFDQEFISGLNLYAKANEGYLFSFGVKECRLKYLFELFEKLAKAQSLESEYIEAYILIRYESENDRVDCIKIYKGTISHRKTSD
ncbi:hypothetical protein [Zooshikella sp. RANM57]|uniref:hypothetical protein n=1 Tax=Zooshikella sp. RANM57 TaxID=3425863 RepID=UPI003D6E1803